MTINKQIINRRLMLETLKIDILGGIGWPALLITAGALTLLAIATQL